MKTITSLVILSAISVATLLRADSSPTPEPGALVTAGLGFNYSRGDYGYATDTEVFSIPFNLGYETGPWLLSVSIPWIDIKGPAANTGAGGPSRPTASEESGLGDIYLGATYRLGPIYGGLNAAATARIKLPTADDARGLGTGETDYYTQVDFYQSIGAFTPFVTLGYRVFGDSALYTLQDGLYTALGSHYRTSDSTVWTLVGNWGHRIIAGGDPSTDITLAITHDLRPQWQINAYLLKGFGDASPDIGTGLQLTYRY